MNDTLISLLAAIIIFIFGIGLSVWGLVVAFVLMEPMVMALKRYMEKRAGLRE